MHDLACVLQEIPDEHKKIIIFDLSRCEFIGSSNNNNNNNN